MKKRKAPKYIYDIPYSKRLNLCRILDASGDWRSLAGAVNFMPDDITLFGFAMQRPGGSPSEDLLTRWGHRNPTVRDLFSVLKKIGCVRGMETLRGLVPDELFQDSHSPFTATCMLNTSEQTTSYNHDDTDELPGPDFSLPEPDNYKAHPFKPSSSLSNGKYPVPVATVSSSSMSSLYQGEDKKDYPFYDNQIIDLHSSKKNNPLRIPVEDTEGPTGYVTTSDPEKPLTLETTQNMTKNTIKEEKFQEYYESAKLSVGEKDSGKESPTEKKLRQKAEKEKLREAAMVCSQHFPYAEIVKATKKFHASHILGRGGFGVVYQGQIGRTMMAIKVLNHKSYGQGDKSILLKQQLAEIEAVSRFPHDNIISINGHSKDGPFLCILYQYMANGSLEDRLACKNHTPPLPWFTRQNILKGAARGIQYLHTAGQQPMIHGDIKSGNILLDRHFEPKISDFGLARQATGGGEGSKYTYASRSQPTDKVFGSEAYLPEEFKRNFKHSIHTDTYAFGVIIYETCTGEKSYDERREGGKMLKDYVEAVWATENEDKVLQIRDQFTQDWPQEMWLQVMYLGKACTERLVKKRPKMNDVLCALEGFERKMMRDSFTESEQSFNVNQRKSPDNSLKAPNQEPVYPTANQQPSQVPSCQSKLPSKHTANHNQPMFNLGLGCQLQQMKLDEIKAGEKLDTEDPKLLISDDKKLALIEEYNNTKKVEKEEETDLSHVNDPDYYKSDPIKLAMLGETSVTEKKANSLEEAQEQSTPYQLQKQYDALNAECKFQEAAHLRQAAGPESHRMQIYDHLSIYDKQVPPPPQQNDCRHTYVNMPNPHNQANDNFKPSLDLRSCDDEPAGSSEDYRSAAESWQNLVNEKLDVSPAFVNPADHTPGDTEEAIRIKKEKDLPDFAKEIFQ